MDKTILVISTQYPGYGGAATNAYAIIKYLRKNGFSTYGVFVEQDRKAIIDPDKIGNIFHFDYIPFLRNQKNKIFAYRKLLDNEMQTKPSIILGKNYFAPRCAKLLYPNVPNICFLAGLENVINICSIHPASKILNEKINIGQNDNDICAIINSSMVVANSPLTLNLFQHCYPEHLDKLYSLPIDTTQHTSNQPTANINKQYDLIITSSILTRPEKNNSFLIKLLSNPVFDNYTKVIVGKNSNIFSSIPNTTIIDLLPHVQVMEVMAKSKVLLCPSYYDSNPNVVREALGNGCLVLLSNNIGYYEKFPKYSVCQTYDENEWTDKILYLINNYNNLKEEYNIELGYSDDLLMFVQKFI